MTRRDRPGALPVLRLIGEYNARGCFIPFAKAYVPFYCFALNEHAIRNGQRITARGWYFVDPANALHGPFAHKADAWDRSAQQKRAATAVE